jgi:AcrR family transcriptional regulator
VRADAERNRGRILAAAVEAFARDGTSVSIDEMARGAGVGPGTVHRHFPTKAALIEEVVAANIRRLAVDGRSLPGANDPVAALFDFVRRMVTEGTQNLALLESLQAPEFTPSIGAAKGELAETLRDLLRQAQSAGAVRRDVDALEVHALAVGCIHAVRDVADELHATLVVGVVLDGLRTPASGSPSRSGRGGG